MDWWFVWDQTGAAHRWVKTIMINRLLDSTNLPFHLLVIPQKWMRAFHTFLAVEFDLRETKMVCILSNFSASNNLIVYSNQAVLRLKVCLLIKQLEFSYKERNFKMQYAWECMGNYEDMVFTGMVIQREPRWNTVLTWRMIRVKV